jgi:hypothetical protein
MFLLIEVSTGKKLLQQTGVSQVGGPNGELVSKGLAVWLEIPVGELEEEVGYVNGLLVVDAVKKKARQDKDKVQKDRNTRLRAADAKVGVLKDLQDIVQDLLDDWKEN